MQETHTCPFCGNEFKLEKGIVVYCRDQKGRQREYLTCPACGSTRKSRIFPRDESLAGVH